MGQARADESGFSEPETAKWSVSSALHGDCRLFRAGDGQFRVWVDGVLQATHADIPNLAGYISNFYFDPVWGGVTETKATNDFMRIDKLCLRVR